MLPEPRAVLFDLDDTLYPLDRFVVSGFAAVAAHLERSWGVARRVSLVTLLRAFHSTARGRELQCCLAMNALSPSVLPDLLDVMRTHVPRLRLPRPSLRTLTALRAGWRIGIVTNGCPAMQARKVAALGLAPLVDSVIYAHDLGRGVGKPDAAVFLEAAHRLRVPVERTVFVGDNPVTDLAGAAGVGMRTIHVAGRRAAGAIVPHGADASVRILTEVPNVAEWLVERNGGVHGV